MVKVVILSAGLGKRLRPLTILTSKSLLPISHSDVIVTKMLRALLRAKDSIDCIFVVLSYLGFTLHKLFRRLFEELKIKYKIIIDDELRGTAGQMLKVKEFIGEEDRIFILNGDVILSESLSIDNVVKYHNANGFELTVVVTPLRLRYGVISDLGGRLLDWIEKPTLNVAAGIYLANGYVVLNHLDGAQYLDMNSWVKTLLKKGVAVGVYEVRDAIRDVGTLTDYVSYLLEDRCSQLDI